MDIVDYVVFLFAYPKMSQQKTFTTAELRGLKQKMEEQNMINSAKSFASTIKQDVLQIAHQGKETRYTRRMHIVEGSQENIIRRQDLITSFIREQFPDISIQFVTLRESSETVLGTTTFKKEMEIIVDWSE